MKIWKILIVFVVLTMAAAGCASSPDKFLPKHAMTNPSDAVSIPHPVEIERAGIKFITTFYGVMDQGLLIETFKVGGVWPVLGLAPKNKHFGGYAYLAGMDYNYDFVIQCVFYYSRLELSKAKFILSNRDGGFAYQLTGKQVLYNPKKFDDDGAYRKEFFEKFGITLTELSNVNEIKVGSPKWQEFKVKIAKAMKYNYKMGNEEIRCSYLPLEIFRQEVVEIPGFNGGERFLKRAKVPLIALPFAGAGMLILAGANVLGDAVAAGVNDDWSGHYARAKVLRHKMAPLFRQICQIYKKLLTDKDKRIKKLESEIRFQQIMAEN